VISILNILKEFWAIARYRAPPRHVLKKSDQGGTARAITHQRVLLRQDRSSFKDTCFLIQSKEVPFALYGPHLKHYKPVPTYLMKRAVGKFAVIARIGAKF
jgi:hypothetical protein